MLLLTERQNSQLYLNSTFDTRSLPASSELQLMKSQRKPRDVYYFVMKQIGAFLPAGHLVCPSNRPVVLLKDDPETKSQTAAGILYQPGSNHSRSLTSQSADSSVRTRRV